MQDAFETIDIITEDLEAYIEERRWDETHNGGAARDKNHDLLMARSMLAILPKIGHIDTCKKNPSMLLRFKNKPRRVIAEVVGLGFILFTAFYTIATVVGLDKMLEAAIP